MVFYFISCFSVVEYSCFPLNHASKHPCPCVVPSHCNLAMKLSLAKEKLAKHDARKKLDKHLHIESYTLKLTPETFPLGTLYH